MKRLVSALVVLTACGLAVTGCGDDDDGGGDTGGTGNAAGEPGSTGGTGNAAGEPGSTGGDTGDTGGAGATPGAGGQPTGNLGCTPSEDTTCQNDTDCPFVTDGTARATAQTCGKGCLGEAETCSRDCILEELAMTSDCASCYADFVNCTIANCVGACLADPDSDGCHTCQQDEGCRPEFNTCSGLPE